MAQQGKRRWIKIDVDAVVRERLPRHYKFIPKPLIAWLKRVLCQDELNGMIDYAGDNDGSRFCRKMLEYLHVDYRLEGEGNLPAASDTHVCYVSNHPLGGLDGIALIDMVTRIHGGVEPWFVVNDLLMSIEPLRTVFVPINKHGRQSRSAATALDDAFASQRPVIVFPAGLVSRKHKGGVIADLRWRKSFVNRCVQSGRDIVPLFFEGTNSSFFYNFAKMRERLGVKFNIEMLRLPKELVRVKNKTFTVHVGKKIPVERLKGGSEAEKETLAIRKIVYSLKDK